MRVFLIVAFSMLHCCIYSQYNVQIDIPSDSLNQVTDRGLRQGVWVEFCNFNFDASYYGHLIGTYSNGQTNGLWQLFFKDELQAEGYFKDDKLEGGVNVYIKGKIRYHMNFVRDKLEGDSRTFSRQGKLLSIHTYRQGKLIDTSCFNHKKCKEVQDDLEKIVPSFYSG